MVRSSPMMQIIFLGSLLATLLYAGLRGAAPERVGALIIALATVATVLVPKAHDLVFSALEPWVFVVDSVTAVAFITLALKAQRYWPMWMAALQVDTVITHIVMLSVPRVMPWAYAAMEIAWSYPIVILLAVGTARHRQRVRDYGADPSWSG